MYKRLIGILVFVVLMSGCVDESGEREVKEFVEQNIGLPAENATILKEGAATNLGKTIGTYYLLKYPDYTWIGVLVTPKETIIKFNFTAKEDWKKEAVDIFYNKDRWQSEELYNACLPKEQDVAITDVSIDRDDDNVQYWVKYADGWHTLHDDFDGGNVEIDLVNGNVVQGGRVL
ncbi:MAG: hypothetical protein Q7J10_04795 [Methanosarcinaceae archaeon]|nr:hypothetical protein [Methanosarcinaceae archaeon]